MKVAAFIPFCILISVLIFASDNSMFCITPHDNVSGIDEKEFARLKITSSNGSFNLPDTVNQKILKSYNENGRKCIIIETGFHNLPALSKNDSEELLLNTRLLKLNDEKVKELAALVKISSDPVKEALYVTYETISNKITGIPIVSADNVIKSRSGDCTEHAVLCAALLRAAGIPSRGVVGAVYVENFENKNFVFVFHMWVEAYHEGKWYIADATRPHGMHPSAYLAFSFHSFSSAIPLSVYEAMASVQDLKIESAYGM